MDLPPYLAESRGRILLDVWVQPRAARDAIVGVHGKALKLKVKAPPVDGRANAAAEELIARTLGLPARAVTVVAGESSRSKRLAIEGLELQRVLCELVRVVSSPAHEPG